MTKKTNTASTFAGAVAAALLIAAFGGTVACKKKETAPPRPAPETTTYSTPATAPAPASSGLEFRELRLGKAINADKSVSIDVGTFAPSDTLYASVTTSGNSASSSIRALWTYQDGQVVSDDTQTISGTGSNMTEFHISKPDGFPVGAYKLEIFIDGRSAMNRSFDVR
jgi:hypothetical protein